MELIKDIDYWLILSEEEVKLINIVFIFNRLLIIACTNKKHKQTPAWWVAIDVVMAIVAAVVGNCGGDFIIFYIIK